MGECITLSHNNAVHFNGVTVVIEVAFSDARIVSMRFRLARLVLQSEPAFSLVRNPYLMALVSETWAESQQLIVNGEQSGL
jgi:hypothetical protein